jgi:HAD superfamily hydrolase (TIGR01509 family)
MLKALLFDFDGLLLDTETPSFEAWVQLFREQGAELLLSDYVPCVGTHGSAFDAVSHLESLTHRPQDRANLERRHREIAVSRIEGLAPLPGVRELLNEAGKRGMGCAVASSSPRFWVEGNLSRLGLTRRFGALVCREDVAHVKPAPDLFLEACRRLGASPSEAVVFEDSLNGVKAARTAGIFCVAVPNPVTKDLPLDALSPDEILRRAGAGRGTA